MGKIEAFQCDHCGTLIQKPRDVYRIAMKGREWQEGPPIDTCQNIIELGFCRNCSRKILTALETIANRK